MKKILTIAVLVGMTAGAMMLSAFTSPKQDAKTECSQIQMNDDWKVFRENVAYCNGDTDMCEGRGKVWVNTDTYQVAFQPDVSSYKFDLTEYTKKDGYNMRFWWNDAYHYVNVYIPAAAFN